ncbi:unnamed protein product [Brachionus calyciflorus]|uniref:PiggyBac transposable element-derived protein domain-containing protein n=1 Tax=Brachionus calyciflorus TaxID=104777 RepID=A0A814KRC0_9BILA|nr:unnamed protein product [Brachionus calyciflorus]
MDKLKIDEEIDSIAFEVDKLDEDFIIPEFPDFPESHVGKSQSISSSNVLTIFTIIGNNSQSSIECSRSNVCNNSQSSIESSSSNVCNNSQKVNNENVSTLLKTKKKEIINQGSVSPKQKKDDFTSENELYSFYHSIWASAAMPSNRFKLLCAKKTLDDIHSKTHRLSASNNNKFTKMSTILENFRKNIKIAYSPGRRLCVDVKLHSYRVRSSFLQYMPSKPAKYGHKFCSLVDNDTNYINSLS